MISSKMIDDVLKCVDPEEVIQLTADPVKINSVWDPVAGTNEQAAAECAARWAEAQGFNVALEAVAAGRPNVIVTHPAGPGRVLELREQLRRGPVHDRMHRIRRDLQQAAQERISERSSAHEGS